MSVALHPVVPVSDAETLRSHLEQYRDFVHNFHRPNNLYYQGDLDLVLREGREFRSVPWRTWRGSGYRRAPERMCFKNAHELALANEELTYCEGFATTGLIPVLHGWCSDAEGRVVDPTWREADRAPVAGWEYLGIPFDINFVDEVTNLKGSYGILDDLDIYNYPLPDGAKKGWD